MGWRVRIGEHDQAHLAAVEAVSPAGGENGAGGASGPCPPVARGFARAMGLSAKELV